MMELLTTGTVPTKTVHSFRKWELTTTHGAHIRTWVIVYDDKSHVQLINKDFYSLVTNGHKVEQEKEELVHSSPPPMERSSPLNPALFEKKSRTKTSNKKREFGRAILFEKRSSLLTNNYLNFRKSVWMSHEDAVVKLPKKFKVIASTKDSKFTIIDQDDQLRLIKNICKAEDIDIKQLAPKYILMYNYIECLLYVSFREI